MCCQKNHVEYEGTATDNGTQTQGNELILLSIAQLTSAPKALIAIQGTIAALKTRIWHRLFSVLGKQANIKKNETWNDLMQSTENLNNLIEPHRTITVTLFEIYFPKFT